MVLYDSLPRPRRSISAAAALEDKCDNSRRIGSSSASRAAAAAAFFAGSYCFPPRPVRFPRTPKDYSHTDATVAANLPIRNLFFFEQAHQMRPRHV